MSVNGGSNWHGAIRRSARADEARLPISGGKSAGMSRPQGVDASAGQVIGPVL